MTRVSPISGKEYFDTFNPLDRYENILFNAGFNLQQREMHEIISLITNRIRTLGQTFFNDGSIVRGGGLIVRGTEVIIPVTEMFIAGIVYTIPSTTLTVTGIGTEVLGIKLTEEIITYIQDNSLLDPALTENYGLPGADRLKITPQWVINDVSAYPVHTLIDGVIKVETLNFDSDPISSWLARRTNDESGSYTVSGLTGSVIEKDTTTLILMVEAGIAYVMGWEIKKPAPVKIEFPKSITSQSVVNETKTYATGTSKYTLNSQPVKQITQLTAQVQITINMTRGATANGLDAIPVQYTPVSSIVSITGYAQTTDYILNGNNISWAPAGSEPSSGATYSVTLIYTKTMTQNTDYRLLHDTDNIDKIEFLSGDRPVNSSAFQTNYDFYLSRKDLFYITKDGDLKILEGTPGIVAPSPPFPIGVLCLGEMDLPPNSSAVVVTNYDPKRLTMEEIRHIRTRLDNIEYNMAIEDLDDAASKMDPATTKKGIFTDGFVNLNKIDMEYPGFACAIDPDDGLLMADYVGTTQDLISNATGTASRFNKFVIKAHTMVIGAQQLKATRTMKVNPYQVYTNTAVVSTTPNQDMWIIVDTIIRHVFRWWNAWTGRTARSQVVIGSDTRIQTRVLMEQLLPFIRQRTLTVKGSRFTYNADNIKCQFDGITVNLTPIAPTVAGTLAGTVKSDAEGKFTATFVIPSNRPTGTREIVVWNEV